MQPDSAGDVTRLLIDWSGGSNQALDQLMPLVYAELRRIARNHLRREDISHTLQSTALVHEAFFRLIDQKQVNWQNRAHFYAVSARMMRRILVDHARRHLAEKRGSGVTMLAIDERLAGAGEREFSLVALDDALGALEQLDAQQAKLVELRFFAGLSVEETAEVLGVSAATVKRHWVTAKAWLYRELARTESGQGA
ncbi:MAG: sigma-70 family RNA polymerase sigma factor [Bryobacteraceae bacterium]